MMHGQINIKLRRHLNGNLQQKDHKEDPSTVGRIISNRIFAKLRLKSG